MFVSLTWREASQGSLHIQEHLVVVLIILSIHFIWRETVFVTSITYTKYRTISTLTFVNLQLTKFFRDELYRDVQ